jgi:hypothetical protein
MKKLSLMSVLSATFLFAAMTVSCANDHYLQAMQKSIQTVYAASTIGELQDAVNSLERIASAEKSKWEPYYYAGFGYIMMANLEKDPKQKDVYLDAAQRVITIAKELVPAESEVIALEGFCYMIRVNVDPGSRGPEFAPLALQTFGKARALNPENPRALMLTAQMQLGTARFFGSSTAEGCDLNRQSLEKFETYKSDNPLAPSWGRPIAESVLQQCK